MIYSRRRGVLSRSLSGYVRADTSNPTGWRPQYKQLSGLSGPNWMTVATARDAVMRQQSAVTAARQNAAMYQASIVDAQARGQRLSGLGSLDPGSQMQAGKNYTFHFESGGGVLGSPDPTSIINAVSSDGNFFAVASGSEGNAFLGSNFYVSFTYNGLGSTVLGAASEMTQVLNDHIPSITGYQFISADGPPPPSGAVGSPGNPSGLQTPQQQQPQQPFDFNTWIQNNWMLLAAIGLGGIVVAKVI